MSIRQLLEIRENMSTLASHKATVAFLGLPKDTSSQDVRAFLSTKYKLQCAECSKRLLEVNTRCLSRHDRREPNFCSTACSNRFNVTQTRSTLVSKYGVTNAFQTEKAVVNRNKVYKSPKRVAEIQRKIERTHLKRRGYRHHFCDPSVISKIQAKSVFAKTVVIARKTFQVRGYEAKAIEWLVSQGVPVKNIEALTVSRKSQSGFDYMWRRKLHHYVPDFLVTTGKGKFVVEVKSPYTAGLDSSVGSSDRWSQLKAKAKSVVSAGHNFVLLVFSQTSPVPVCTGRNVLTKASLLWT